ncbi:hypothetical protein AAFF_G00082510 [Aldrovandia affinis]|uniref:Uncharacterized protein n=1 Tax=Aldrovandia affinis TaxID=143900 RepID=A0AAD7WZD0_9TELE|nr:hypothetical protein AAFF_G00082510 [Aldrovandia affinis]
MEKKVCVIQTDFHQYRPTITIHSKPLAHVNPLPQCTQSGMRESEELKRAIEHTDRLLSRVHELEEENAGLCKEKNEVFVRLQASAAVLLLEVFQSLNPDSNLLLYLLLSGTTELRGKGHLCVEGGQSGSVGWGGPFRAQGKRGTVERSVFSADSLRYPQKEINAERQRAADSEGEKKHLRRRRAGGHRSSESETKGVDFKQFGG